ncbi:response regulator transcription factor [Amycolatopsis sp. 195334CR]|uniref:response regulator transcription factor n=1 Tax=Amycolatopsis sp. 195334CR TaxID=2814588 RepID=UPI001A8BFA2C|nr:response regulator transcription factor [Amycolatopsis sp. 195334CR]MBN6040611.1 response regulator transcription factor [Amycolatopsis sp. 195334CR]
MARILYTDDDPDRTSAVVTSLRQRGFEVSKVDDESAVVAWAPFADVVVLDLDLPALNGYEACRRIRAACAVPVIGTAEHDSDLDRVLGLCSGLSAFLPKPFDARQLLQRVHAASGRGGPRPDEIVHGPLRVTPQRREVRVGERPVELTRKEFDLLHLLAAEPGRVFTRREIMYVVWNDEWAQSSRTIDTHVSSLRGKLGLTSVIHTVRGVGFRMGFAEQLRPFSASA